MPQVTIDAFHLGIKLYIYFLKNETMTLQIFHLKDKSEGTAIHWQSWLQHYDQEETESCQIKGKKKRSKSPQNQRKNDLQEQNSIAKLKWC